MFPESRQTWSLTTEGGRVLSWRADGREILVETPPAADLPSPSTMTRHVVVVSVLGGGLAAMIAGAILWSWGIVHFTAVLLGVGVVAGLAGALKLRGTSNAIQEGFRRLAYAAVLIGVARAISVVLDQGAILDTITNALFQPPRAMPPTGTGLLTFVFPIFLVLAAISGTAIVVAIRMGLQ